MPEGDDMIVGGCSGPKDRILGDIEEAIRMYHLSKRLEEIRKAWKRVGLTGWRRACAFMWPPLLTRRIAKLNEEVAIIEHTWAGRTERLIAALKA